MVISLIYVAIFLIVVLFIGVVFMCQVNSTLYNLKLTMYSINKAGILAVNKNRANIDNFSYAILKYREYFEDGLKSNYRLDSNFSNSEKLISKIEIEDYKIYEKSQKDSFTGKKCDDITLHTVIEVKLRPIIFKEFFEDILTFEVHEDVNMNIVDM